MLQCNNSDFLQRQSQLHSSIQLVSNSIEGFDKPQFCPHAQMAIDFTVYEKKHRATLTIVSGGREIIQHIIFIAI